MDTQAPKPELTIVRTFEKEQKELRSIMEQSNQLLPTFERNVNFLAQITQRVTTVEKSQEALAKDVQEAFNHIGRISDILKEEKSKDAQLRLDIISAVQKENEGLREEIERINSSVALCTLELDTTQSLYEEQNKAINELQKNSSLLVTTQTHINHIKTLREDISKLQKSNVEKDTKLLEFSHNFAAFESEKKFFRILGVANFLALVFLMWWHTHKV